MTQCVCFALVDDGDITSEDHDGSPHHVQQVTIFAPHHKNTHRGFPAIEVTLPKGLLTDLLVIHIKEGHTLLTKGKEQPMLFVTPSSGQPFSKSTICQYWSSLMDRTVHNEFQSCTITALRTAFVEGYTGAYGMPAEEWEGAANIMGNSSPAWHAHYAPTLRKRRSQAAADSHAVFRARINGGST